MSEVSLLPVTSELCVCVCVTVARFAREKVQPLVRKMDEESHMDRSVITGMFDQGVSPRERERRKRAREREGVCVSAAAADGD